MKLRCWPGCIAEIVDSISPENIGALVKVKQRHFPPVPVGQNYVDFGGIWLNKNDEPCWVVEGINRPILSSDGIPFWERAYGDRRLRPINPPPGTVSDEEVKELFSPGPAKEAA